MKPFLKWVGGKRGLIPQYQQLGLIPKSFNTYYEPFLGGGAMFFYLYEKGLIKQALLSDINTDLINTYNQVKNNLTFLKAQVSLFERFHQRCQDGSYYQVVREIGFNSEEDTDLQKAARFIFLNKSCRSGMFRVNKAGKFNVPMGEMNQKIYQPDLLDGANKALKSGAHLLNTNGLDLLRIMQSGDFAFVDPPYHQTFGEYSKERFSESDQTQLRDILIELNNRGVKFLTTNSDTPLIRTLYSDVTKFRVYEVERSGQINSKLKNRGKIKELAIVGVSNNGRG